MTFERSNTHQVWAAGQVAAEVLPLVMAAERAAVGESPIVPVQVSGRLARRLHPVPGIDPEDLSDPTAVEAASIVSGEVLEAPLRSALLVAGKFADGRHHKARAYLPGDHGRPASTLKVWAGWSAPLGLRERTARGRVASVPGYRAVPVLREGAVADGHYLLEPLIRGRHPADMAERRTAAADLITSLSGAYAQSGIRDRRLRRITGRRFRRRLLDLLTGAPLPWDPGWGDRAALTRRVGLLVRENLTLPCALGHGDLVPSNIIRDDAGAWWLTDWEQARPMPVAFDLTKLFLTTGDLGATGLTAADVLAPFDGDGRRRYRWHEQVALGVCRMLSMTASRIERAERVGRQAAMQRQLAQHLSWLSQLLDH